MEQRKRVKGKEEEKLTEEENRSMRRVTMRRKRQITRIGMKVVRRGMWRKRRKQRWYTRVTIHILLYASCLGGGCGGWLG